MVAFRWKLVGGALALGMLTAYLYREPMLDRAGGFLVLEGGAAQDLSADLIVVLDGSPLRHKVGVRLLKKGVAPRILFTMRRPTEDRYRAYEVPEGLGVVPVRASDTTFEEALAVRDTVLGRGLDRLLLVTSDYHTRRAARIFRKVLGPGVNLSVHPVDSGYLGNGRKWWRDGPSRRVVVGEHLKLAYYAVRFPGSGGIAGPSRLDLRMKSVYRWIMELFDSDNGGAGTQAAQEQGNPGEVAR